MGNKSAKCFVANHLYQAKIIRNHLQEGKLSCGFGFFVFFLNKNRVTQLKKERNSYAAYPCNCSEYYFVPWKHFWFRYGDLYFTLQHTVSVYHILCCIVIHSTIVGKEK